MVGGSAAIPFPRFPRAGGWLGGAFRYNCRLGFTLLDEGMDSWPTDTSTTGFC